MSISSLVLELRQFSFIRDWPEIQKLEILPSRFFQISGDWGELRIPNLAWMSLINCYWILQNTKVTAFTVFELLRENQQAEVKLGLNVLHFCFTRIIKKRLRHRCFPVNFVKFLRIIFFYRTPLVAASVLSNMINSNSNNKNKHA